MNLEQLARKTAEECYSAPGFTRTMERLILGALRQAVGPLQDRLDLMRDEFKRIAALQFSPEITALCERAQIQIEQVVPVVVQRDQLQWQLSTRDALLRDMAALLSRYEALKKESECA